MSAVMGTSTNSEIDQLFHAKNRQLAVAVINIVNELKPYWPLIVRQVYYQCVSGLLIQNKQSAYIRYVENVYHVTAQLPAAVGGYRRPSPPHNT